MYYVMNPSLVEPAEAKLVFGEEVAGKVVRREKTERFCESSFRAQVAPGEGILIRIYDKKEN